MIKAVLFDLDGILFDGGHIHYQALNLALGECGYPTIGIEEHRKTFDGLPTKEKLRKLVEDRRIQARDSARIEKAKRTNTIVLMRSLVTFDAEMYCIVAGVKAWGMKIGVVTNSIRDTTMFVLGKLQITADVIVTNEDARPKPDPSPYRMAYTHLGLKPDECLVFEDGQYGVKSATDAGCRVVQVKGFVEMTPDFVFRYLS